MKTARQLNTTFSRPKKYPESYVTGWPQHWPGSMQTNVVQAVSVVLFALASPNNFSQVLVTRLPQPNLSFKLQQLVNLQYSQLFIIWGFTQAS